jgi:lactate racemase
MRVAVEFQDEQVELDVPEDRLAASWRGPAGVNPAEAPGLVVQALESPRGFPPLRLAVVPGDRVVIALGRDVPEPGPILQAVCGVLESAGVEHESITVLADPDAKEEIAQAVPRGVVFQRHDPEDRKQLAYLAATSDDRRVYLNRLLTDADFVLPIGRIAHDQALGYRGPWGVIFPDLSDAETRGAFRAKLSDGPPDRSRPTAALKESNEVGWLLGGQFQIGIVAGVAGMRNAIAGLGTEVLLQGAQEVDEVWSVRASSRAELVVAGIGRPGVTARISDVARGLATAMQLVQRGGKIVVLSRAQGPIGPAMRRIISAEDPRAAAAALRGHESASDYPAARQLVQALAWADVYMLSALGPDAAEELGMVGLDRPEEARRLAAISGSCAVVSHADLAWASVVDEPG